MQRIVFLDRSTVDATFRTPQFEHTWIDHPFTDPDQVVARLEGATIAITNKVRIEREALAHLPDLRMIAIAATGTDVVDLEACKERKIAVSNVRDYAAVSVAEHVFALILALQKNVLGWKSDVVAGEWSRARIFCLTNRKVRSLEGTTLGIVGYGSIGREVARLGRAFRMEVLIAEHRGAPLREGRTPFEEVLARADVLTLHAPLVESTRAMIGEAELRSMKPSAILINTARGALIDERALLAALEEKRIAGAAVDVLSKEPPPTDHPLLTERDDLIVTPHVAWRSDASQQALADQIVDALEGFVRGVPVNSVSQGRSGRP